MLLAALKALTRADYLAMVEGARTTEKGTRQAAGFLHPIARKLLTELTANDIREAYDAAAKKSPRRATYAVQVLRAVPAAGASRSTATGCSATRRSPGGDVDQRAGRVVLRDTKNRNDHKLLLSTQALEIAKRMGRKPEEPLFPVGDARKTLAWINKQAGTNVQGHGLRATFASIAEELVSSALLKRMLNHAAAGDVTLGHYVAKSEAQFAPGGKRSRIPSKRLRSADHGGVVCTQDDFLTKYSSAKQRQCPV